MKLYEDHQETKQEEDTNEKGYHFNQRIRMANLGFQYDWPHRCYPKTQVPIPATIRALTSKAQHLFQRLSAQELDYHGEAVIVNYYKPKEYMIGHLDDGEEDQKNPIFSFNFGLSCVFLLGGPDKQIEPLALKLEAGDLLSKCAEMQLCLDIQGSAIMEFQESSKSHILSLFLVLKWREQLKLSTIKRTMITAKTVSNKLWPTSKRTESTSTFAKCGPVRSDDTSYCYSLYLTNNHLALSNTDFSILALANLLFSSDNLSYSSNQGLNLTHI